MKIIFWSLLFSLSSAVCAVKDNHKIVIAHRGASGYLPEHSLASKAMAYAMGVDYIEQDVVMSKDDHLMVLHDIFLDQVTNVREKFPNRYRMLFGQKRWFAIDFTLAEIKSLSMTERFHYQDDNKKYLQVYPNRFPIWHSHFQVSTLQEEIELIQGLNKSTGKNVGLYVEIKSPWFHRHEGKDISLKTLKVLKQFGYHSKADKIFLQCFDPDELQRIHHTLFPQLKLQLNLIQLIAETSWNETMRLVDGKLTPYDYNWMLTQAGLKKISQYADGIGPWKAMIISDQSTADHLIISKLVAMAHNQGLLVHPYTYRADALPPYVKDFDSLLNLFLYQQNVDGIFTDFPDKAIKFIQKQQR